MLVVNYSGCISKNSILEVLDGFICMGRLRAAIFQSAVTVHCILLYYFGYAIRCAVSADLKMAARNRPLVFLFV